MLVCRQLKAVERLGVSNQGLQAGAQTVGARIIGGSRHAVLQPSWHASNFADHSVFLKGTAVGQGLAKTAGSDFFFLGCALDVGGFVGQSVGALSQLFVAVKQSLEEVLQEFLDLAEGSATMASQTRLSTSLISSTA